MPRDDTQPAPGPQVDANVTGNDNIIGTNITVIQLPAGEASPEELKRLRDKVAGLTKGKSGSDSLDLLLKRAKSLESEVMAGFSGFFNDMTQAVQQGRLQVTQTQSGPSFESPDRATKAHWTARFKELMKRSIIKVREALALLAEAGRLDPYNTEVLLLQGSMLIYFPGGAAGAREALMKVVTLIDRPKDDEQRYQLACARYGMAAVTAEAQMKLQLLQDARADFERLGEQPRVRQCDAALAQLQSGGAPQPSPARPAQPSPSGFQPVGHWRIDVQMFGMTTAVWDVQLQPNGAFQGTMQPMIGFPMPIVGNWAFDPGSQLLRMTVGFQSSLITIQGGQGNSWHGINTVGESIVFTRL